MPPKRETDPSASEEPSSSKRTSKRVCKTKTNSKAENSTEFFTASNAVKDSVLGPVSRSGRTKAPKKEKKIPAVLSPKLNSPNKLKKKKTEKTEKTKKVDKNEKTEKNIVSFLGAPSTSKGNKGVAGLAALAKMTAKSNKAALLQLKKKISLKSFEDSSDSDDDDDDDDDDGEEDIGASVLPAMMSGVFTQWSKSGPPKVTVPVGMSSQFAAAAGGLSGMANYNNWDPRHSTDWDNSAPLPMCKKRLQHDLAHSLSEEEELNIFIQPNEADITKLHALVIGPKDTPYEGGFFQLYVRVGPDYPLKPPRVCLLTTANGRVRFGPNLYADGKICLSILGTWTGPSWTAAMTISVVLSSIQSLMSVGAMRNEPGFEKRPLTDPGVVAYDENVRFETIKIAILENLERVLQSEPSELSGGCGGGGGVGGRGGGVAVWPEKFRQAMFKSFHKEFNDLLTACEIELQKTKEKLQQKKQTSHSQLNEHGTVPRHDWASLKARLVAMKKKVPHFPQHPFHDDVIDC